MSNNYYSGQGSLYVAERNADGTNKGFIALGNVPALEISVEVTKFEHKEAESGSRAVDLTIVQEKKGTFSMTMESITPENLALAFWGSQAARTGAAETDVLLTARVHATMYDYRVPIEDPATGQVYAGLSSVTIDDDAAGTNTYEFGTTPGTTASPGTSKNGWIDETNGVIVIFNTAEQTARSAAILLADEDPMYVNFTDSNATVVHAFTESSQERWLRFEGLNTINDSSVIIDMFKCSLDPLAGYQLINEELGTLEITGSVLYDNLQPGTSKYFRQVNL